jgi:predicted ATPase/DNA-binding winged helix-turn-helix (wHTH) protein
VRTDDIGIDCGGMTHASDREISTVLRFGRFMLQPGRQLLQRDGAPVPLGSRAFALLLELARRAGQPVSKQELLDAVWPGVVVAEVALRVHLTAVRKALGDADDGAPFIISLAGRGYQFVQPVVVEEPATPIADLGQYVLPPEHKAIVGRRAAVERLAAAMAERRLQTLVGPGGIGKTTTALAIARERPVHLLDGACFVDLARLQRDGSVDAALATALGVAALSDDPIPEILATLGRRRLLIVLDNCEHVIDAAAVAAERLLDGAPDIRILATSREPLRINGEWVHRLDPLTTPPADAAMSPAALREHSAVELFILRAASQCDVEIDDEELPLVADICRRLDGLPLAIELAAARVDAFGVRGLAERLDQRLAILTEGRRTALPRQQTLRAALDWSYELLAGDERETLAALSVFVGSFTLDGAQQVVGSERSQMVSRLSGLVTRSLLSTDVSGPVVRYRLLQVTREYAERKLEDAGASTGPRRAHARHVLALTEHAAAGRATDPPPQALPPSAELVDEVRAALDRSFAPEGDEIVGANLTAASAALWLELRVMAEYRNRLEFALERVRTASRDPGLELRLTTVLGQLVYDTGSSPHALEALNRAAAIAEEVSDPAQRLAALMALYVEHGSRGDYGLTLRLAALIGQVAEQAGHPHPDLMRRRYECLALHLNGDQAGAAQHAEFVRRHPGLSARSADASGLEFDAAAAAHAVRARVLFMQGCYDQASDEAETAVQRALALEHSPSFYFAQSIAACPVAIWTGRENTWRSCAPAARTARRSTG